MNRWPLLLLRTLLCLFEFDTTVAWRLWLRWRLRALPPYLFLGLLVSPPPFLLVPAGLPSGCLAVLAVFGRLRAGGGLFLFAWSLLGVGFVLRPQPGLQYTAISSAKHFSLISTLLDHPSKFSILVNLFFRTMKLVSCGIYDAFTPLSEMQYK